MLIAFFERRTDESIATRCSVKTNGQTDECLSIANRSQIATSSILILILTLEYFLKIVPATYQYQ